MSFAKAYQGHSIVAHIRVVDAFPALFLPFESVSPQVLAWKTSRSLETTSLNDWIIGLAYEKKTQYTDGGGSARRGIPAPQKTNVTFYRLV